MNFYYTVEDMHKTFYFYFFSSVITVEEFEPQDELCIACQVCCIAFLCESVNVQIKYVYYF